MNEEPTERRIVIRSPQHAASETRPDATSDPASATVTPPPRTNTPEARSPGNSDERLGIALGIVGGLVLCFGPLLPWWRLDLHTLVNLVQPIGGLGTWQGVVCLVAGATLVGVDALRLNGSGRDLKVVGLIAALVGAAAAMTALVVGPPSGAGTGLVPQPGLWITIVGGLCAAAGASIVSFGDRP